MANLDSNFVICDKEKLENLHKRAESGDAESQYLLGMHLQDAEFEEAYDESIAADIPDREAAHWLTKAAEQEIVAAQFALGNAYRDGYGVRKKRSRRHQVVSESRRDRSRPGDVVDRRDILRRGATREAQSVPEGHVALQG